MTRMALWFFAALVALRKESVDRNLASWSAVLTELVALRKESVDRNDAVQIVIVVVHAVALRKESVDRNIRPHSRQTRRSWSLSARRAWIEIVVQFSLRSARCCRSPQGERG